MLASAIRRFRQRWKSQCCRLESGVIFPFTASSSLRYETSPCRSHPTVEPWQPKPKRSAMPSCGLLQPRSLFPSFTNCVPSELFYYLEIGILIVLFLRTERTSPLDHLVRWSEFWNWVPVFRVVAEANHLRTAATILSISRSAISRTIRLLADNAGEELLDPHGRSLQRNAASMQATSSLSADVHPDEFPNLSRFQICAVVP